MPARSFAVDSWATRLLFLGIANGHLRRFLEEHRCSIRGGSNFGTRWQLGPEYTIVEFECVNCHQIQGMAVRTPFNLFEDPVAEYLQDGWPELLWDSVIASWQLSHRDHVAPDNTQFILSRAFSNGRITLSLLCPCGKVSPPSSGWALEGVRIPTERPQVYRSALTDPVSELPKAVRVPRLDNPERLVRHRVSGRLYRLPAFTIHLEPADVGESQPLSCSVENLGTEFDRFYSASENVRGRTWHERLVKE